MASHFLCHRPCWSVGYSWSSWDRRLYSKGVLLHSFTSWYFLSCVQGSTCDQSGQNPLKHSATVRDLTWGKGKTESELSHWAIMTRTTGRTVSKRFHWAIMTRTTGRTDSEVSHWAIMTRTTGRTDSEIFHGVIMTRAKLIVLKSKDSLSFGKLLRVSQDFPM